MFDKGAIYLSVDLKVIEAGTGCVRGDLQVHADHIIDIDVVRYHRLMFGH
jgi:hypothetical protein